MRIICIMDNPEGPDCKYHIDIKKNVMAINIDISIDIKKIGIANENHVTKNPDRPACTLDFK